MKERIVICLMACMMLAGCGKATGQFIEPSILNPAVTEESTVLTPAVTEETTVNENSDASAMELFKGFLGIEGEAVSAVSDVEISVDDYDGAHIFDFKQGDKVYIEDLKRGILNGEWADENKILYTFFYENTESPVLAVLIPYNPNYPDENNCTFFFNVVDGEVHLASYKDVMADGATYSYVGKDGLISYNALPLGRSSSGLIFSETYIVDKDGQLVKILKELMIAHTEAEYHVDDERAFALFYEMYSDDNHSYISKAECGSETYFVLYSDETDTALDESYIEACDKEGIKICTRDELIPVVNEYIKKQGFDADIADLDNNKAEWGELQ